MSLPEPPRRRPRRLLRGMMWLLLVLIGVVGGAAYRLTQGPIALPDWTVARVEERLSRGLAPNRLSVGGVALAYDLEAQALRLQVRDAQLVPIAPGPPLATVPEARVALDGAALLRGKVRPRQMSVTGLILDISRDADGRLSLAFGRDAGALPSTWPEALAALDDALATPVIADLMNVQVDGVTLRFRDAITGLDEQVEDGNLEWRRDGSGVAVALSSGFRLGGRTAELEVRVRRDGRGQGAQADVALRGLSLSGLAEVVPNVPALTLVTGQVAATATISLSEDGVPGPLVGRLVATDSAMVDRPVFALDRAVLAFDWVPGSDRIGLTEISASSDALQVGADGQILLEEGLTGAAQLQLRLGRTILDPDGMFDRRVEFEQGVFEARLTQDILGLRIGQAMLTGPSGTARVSGRLTFEETGVAGSLRLAVPQMEVGELVALWPPDLLPQSRDWFVTNMLGGLARDATGLVRLHPDAPPDVLASFAFEDGRFRYMRFMPPAEEAWGAAQLDGNRLTIRVDRGTVPAIGPATPDPSGRIDIAGSVFAIPDATVRPANGELNLLARGSVPDMLTLLDNAPFRLLQRLDRGRDLASGQAEARVEVRLPLKKGNAPADIFYAVEADLRGVESRTLIPGRNLTGEALTLTANAERVQIGGDLRLDGVPFSGRWSQALPPPSTEPIDPDAPPPTGVPRLDPGEVTGVARIDPDGLSRLGIAIDAFDLRGTTSARIRVRLPQGQPPRLSVESDLAGLSVALPAISWSKPRDRAATLTLEATLGETPEVTAVALDARGLSARGSVTLRPGGGLERANFDRVDTGWFQGPLVLTGRGAGAAPAISIRGGSADLRQALLVGGDGGGGDGAPLDIALNRLTISEGIALTDLRATLRNSSGQFTGRLNGGAAVEGVVAPQGGGTAVQVRGTDAGAVLRSAGLFEDARGGSLTLTLRPTGQTGVYAGAVRMADVRVRNAPALASLLQALSVVGILEQLGGEGLFFQTVETDFTLRPDDIVVQRASAVGPSMSITADGRYDLGSKRMDLQGVISPIYLVNGLFGALFARRDEGLFGFTYRLTGAAAAPNVSVNPLSILTPGVFREIFRRAPPS
ncbi:AsmA-like C-terminal region-containing protein [Jannaschia pohangensis]|uniref:AsmA-like C-terminal region n=1 Tax=Jannaschia pohangensis TaxID=390807 RepID=A0A1I3I4C1_9RHOB|nr:AsmA-like C-terminal region-containing protein [Jannaschia pohangensis]SFI42816.1 AsmA-like C-terminal region [Jannaschia pohangensis]